MSEENVENLRARLETWGREPFTPEGWHSGEGMDTSLLDPDVIYEDTVLPDHIGEQYRGLEGVLRATERWLEPWEWLLVELERIEGTGDRLVSIHRWSARARHTGIELDGPVAYAWTFRDGRVVHFKSFIDPAQALKAAGLSE